MAAAGTLSKTFNQVAWETLKFTFNAVVIGFLIGGVIDYSFFHNHKAGAALIDLVNEPLQSFFDNVVTFFGFPQYATDPAASGLCPDAFTGIAAPC
jgi:hypothetical protein